MSSAHNSHWLSRRQCLQMTGAAAAALGPHVSSAQQPSVPQSLAAIAKGKGFRYGATPLRLYAGLVSHV